MPLRPVETALILSTTSMPSDHFGKHAVAPALQVFAAEVQEVVIHNIDEELRGSGVRSLSPGHRQRTTGVFQTVVGFVFNRFFGCLSVSCPVQNRRPGS